MNVENEQEVKFHITIRNNNSLTLNEVDFVEFQNTGVLNYLNSRVNVFNSEQELKITTLTSTEFDVIKTNEYINNLTTIEVNEILTDKDYVTKDEATDISKQQAIIFG